ncbi:MAG: peptide chain release factor N(5)-glutamine methyltransferase [Xanthomonadales bacterium]|nr:peptide chain release factor N(5)-glutamine methyltransferase [Xanthomonadales bacterium]
MPQKPSLSLHTTVATLTRAADEYLSVDDARREVELLLEHALGTDRAWLFAHPEHELDTDERARLAGLLERRQQGEPLAYVLGHVGFWTLDLAVSPATLIPRAETELLVEAALERIPVDRAVRIVDLGTGSGAIALALASERPDARVLASDASADALRVAQSNAQRNGVDNVEFRLGDWLAPLQNERFDLIASNPPYVAEGDPHLERGDLRFEPAMALACGADGLSAIRHIVTQAPTHLAAGGWLLLEHGFEQGPAVRDLMRQAGFSRVHSRKDLEARERVTLGQRET